jgi:hypothetical protein
MGTTIAKRLMIGLLGAALVPAFAASAQVADQPIQQDDAKTQDANAQAEQEQAKKPDVNDRNCMRHTGSRIPPRVKKDGTCVDAHGNAYTRDDLYRTGEINTADALRKADVSISIDP